MSEFESSVLAITVDLLTRSEHETYPFTLVSMTFYTVILSFAGLALTQSDPLTATIELLLCPLYHCALTFLIHWYGRHPGACIGLVLTPASHETLRDFVQKNWYQIFFKRLSNDATFDSLKVDRQGFEVTRALVELWKNETLSHRLYYLPSSLE